MDKDLTKCLRSDCSPSVERFSVSCNVVRNNASFTRSFKLQFDDFPGLAHQASDPEKFLARPQNLLVSDNRMGLLSTPDVCVN